MRKTHTIHMNDAVNAYNLINHTNTPEYAKDFRVAMVQNAIKVINGVSSNRLVILTTKQYTSYIEILNNASRLL